MIFLKFKLYATIGQNVKIDIHCIEFMKFGENISLEYVKKTSTKT